VCGAMVDHGTGIDVGNIHSGRFVVASRNDPKPSGPSMSRGDIATRRILNN
jgi:hypothetical protein